MKSFFRKHWYFLLVALIIFLAFILRFYDYENRWGLAYDQAHDVLIARYSIESFKLPLLGPFSSAGPFQTGGEWYWFIISANIIFFNSVMTPWIVLTLTYVLFVYLMIVLGKELVDKKFGLIVGLLSAVSTAQITQGSNLTNQSPLAIISLFCIWFSIKYIRQKKEKYLFLLAFFIGLASSIHLQGVSLLVILVFVIVFSGLPSLKGILLIILGLLIPWAPVFIVDLQHNFSNTKNMVYYYLFDQYKIPYETLGRRWLTYLGVFLPSIWSEVIGGVKSVGYIIIVVLIWGIISSLLKKKITREWGVILLSFLGMVTVVRYLRTPLFPSYVVFLHPFILLLTGWAILIVLKRNLLIAYLFLALIIGGSLYTDVLKIIKSENFTAYVVKLWIDRISEKYPGKKFAVYDLNYERGDKSLPLVLFLDSENKLDDNGFKIGLGMDKSGKQAEVYPVILGERGDYQFFDLNSSTGAELSKGKWYLISPELIYSSTQDWKRNK